MTLSKTLFISDLHLSPADPATAQAFQRFLTQQARHASQLYILGDLFEMWIGDDQLDDPFYAEVAASIATLAEQGVAVFFMPGNRDFVCGTRFAQAAKLQILTDPSVITLANRQRVLLAHGDAYCTDDVAYMRFRRIIRNPLVRMIWLALPFGWRNRKAGQLRQQSSAMNRNKMRSIMDVNAAAIENALRRAQVDTLIHGHTHRPARHQEAAGTRWVLPDWYAGMGGYLQWQDGQWQMLTLNDTPLLDDTGKSLPDSLPPAHQWSE
ncbi:UDP-2,3-diacylglucosamine diphosphatase [Silvimonas sp.]|uniref:UDP-2,3-diacylglucosamine diphosphatase n=1 Tax=Silvimonas sp. TaxID=2650811 RepID=UPI00284CB1BD|nr:UDP-2,3-diacylglucosamine diphosphatase [Silvimonas sp.]MDR3427206.1 UDP-2,3-diacylglucosamine diphosphatase [Silvimonas sp.]